jgi:hypothetical protein
MTTQETNYEPLFDFWGDILTPDVLNAAIMNTLSHRVWGRSYNELTVTIHIEPARSRIGAENYLSFTASTELTEYDFKEEEEQLFNANQNKYWREFMANLIAAYYSNLTDGTVELILTLQENGDVTYSHAGFDGSGAQVETKYVSVWERM